MLHTLKATRGMVSAPHHLAAQSGLAVLREGGNAIEATLAAAATLAVVHPHLSGLGGDGFWLIAEPGKVPISIDGSGAAAAAALPALYRGHGLGAIPAHGPLAALTVAGTVSGWQAAQEMASRWDGRLPLARLFEDAIHYARNGSPVSDHQACAAEALWPALAGHGALVEGFGVLGEPPQAGREQKQPALADTFGRLATRGLDDFYRGALGQAIGTELQRQGSPLGSADLARHRSVRRRPLSLNLQAGTLYNLPPPTQGLASLMILGLFERLGVSQAESFEHVHGLVEATRQAFQVRDAHLGDPAYMAVHATTYLSDSLLDRMAAALPRRQAQPRPVATNIGDTAWVGVIDGQGRAVSFIQSLSQAFGSGLLLAETGVLWHNHGTGFSLDEAGRNTLSPGRKPLHSLSPALARLRDGRVMVYGGMGGDIQPQAQAAIFSRYTMFGQPLQEAVSAPRWALGPDLQMEGRCSSALTEALRRAGHRVAMVEAYDPRMGHAGAVVRHENGLLEGATDPRADGCVAAY